MPLTNCIESSRQIDGPSTAQRPRQRCRRRILFQGRMNCERSGRPCRAAKCCDKMERNSPPNGGGTRRRVEGIHVRGSVQREAATRCTGVNRPPANLHTPKPSCRLLDGLEFLATKLPRFIRRVYLSAGRLEKKKLTTCSPR